MFVWCVCVCVCVCPVDPREQGLVQVHGPVAQRVDHEWGWVLGREDKDSE